MKIFLLLIICTQLWAKPTIVATLPELKWIVDEIAGNKIESQSILNGNEDPHFVDATPSFILKVSNASLVVANGLDLEVGWLPKVIQMAGNSKIQFNANGYCDASQNITKTQVIPNYDRSMGDVHPLGNPHYTLSISQMKLASKKILECLISIDADNSNFYQKNQLKLMQNLSAHLTKIQELLKPLVGKFFMTYHQEFIYYQQDFNLSSQGTLESVPGILPSAAHLFNISKDAIDKKVVLVLASNTNPKKYLEKFKEMTKIPFVQLPLHMGDTFKDYLDFQSHLAMEILANANRK